MIAAVRHTHISKPTSSQNRETFNMEESGMFIQWAMNTLLDEPPAAPPAVDDGCRGQATFQSLQPLPQASYAAETTTMDHDACLLPLPNSSWHAPTGGGSNSLAVSWMNFSGGDGMPETSTTMTTRGLPQPPAYGGSMPPPMRRAGVRNTGSSSSTSPAAYAHEHIIAERKRREKISQRFVELSAVIPGLKKMDKATILSDATRYVKELQEKLSAREAAGGGVIIRRSSSGGNVPALSPLGASSTGTKPLPEIEAQLCVDKVMVRVLCHNGKGVVAKVLAEVEDLHLRIVDANAIPSPLCTLNITITAKVRFGAWIALKEGTNQLLVLL
ncbi:hypothetical protein HU200_018175 [Digitaria exilis]|uniref:BHLH domain-containing protein n=1 Tax=Digitaria exilis TaxID=1010633 RepID=A0A835KF52_9POAL|nr:hypothetical protein HU200_018175 [Digitaria exilis]